MSCEGLIDFIFAHERDIRAAVREKRLDPGGITGGNGTGHSKISDPTAAQGIRLALPIAVVVVEYGAAIGGVRSSKSIRRPEKWLQVIAETKEFYKGKKQGEFISRRYGHEEAWQDACKAMRCNKASYYAMRADVVRFAEKLAIGYGMISPWQKK